MRKSGRLITSQNELMCILDEMKEAYVVIPRQLHLPPSVISNVFLA